MNNIIKLRNVLLISVVFGISSLNGIPVSGQQGLDFSQLPENPTEKAHRIMTYVDDLWRGTSSLSEITMQVKTKHWTRTLKMKAWSLGKDYSLVRILSPKKEEGTSTLKYEKNIYNYLPKTDRTIKISSGMMMSSWMGSHFTNDDLVKESRFSDDYTPLVIFDGDRDGRKIWEVALTPKPEAPVVWGKIVFVVRQEDVLPVKAIYYNESDELIRTMHFSDYKIMDNKNLPSKMKLTPEDKSGEFTELIYNEIDFDIGLEKSFFSLRKLKAN